MQTRSPLRIYHDVNWAYAPRVRKQFCVKNILNNRKITKCHLEVTFVKQKLKSCRIEKKHVLSLRNLIYN